MYKELSEDQKEQLEKQRGPNEVVIPREQWKKAFDEAAARQNSWMRHKNVGLCSKAFISHIRGAEVELFCRFVPKPRNFAAKGTVLWRTHSNMSEKPQPGQLERKLREVIRRKHMSRQTEDAYTGWYRRFVRWHGGKTHPKDLGAPEVEAFLTHLAVNRGVSAATQNQALNALVFLYREVLEMELAGIDAQRARRTKRLPVVLTSGEVKLLLDALGDGPLALVVRLLYGCGLRVAEALALRVKDVDLEGGKLEVRGGKGDKDRVVTLPKSLLGPLRAHRARIQLWHEEDRAAGAPGVELPHAFAAKQPIAAESWPWFWFFPGKSLSSDPRSGIVRRHHLHEIGVTRELERAAKAARLGKRVTAHVLRHSFATHLILRGVDIRSVQQILGHADVRTTEVYTELARAMRGEITSPLDDL